VPNRRENEIGTTHSTVPLLPARNQFDPPLIRPGCAAVADDGRPLSCNFEDRGQVPENALGTGDLARALSIYVKSLLREPRG